MTDLRAVRRVRASTLRGSQIALRQFCSYATDSASMPAMQRVAEPDRDLADLLLLAVPARTPPGSSRQRMFAVLPRQRHIAGATARSRRHRSAAAAAAAAAVIGGSHVQP